MSWQWTGQVLFLDPKRRPWYHIGVEGNGAGRWTDPYLYADEKNVGITATMMARSAAGELGVVALDLTLSSISQFLKTLKAQIDTAQSRADNAATLGFQMALIHASGTLIATSSDDPLSRDARQLNWSEALATPVLRGAVETVSAACQGNWSRLFDGAAELRTYAGGRADVLVAAKPYGDQRGLRIVLISAVPMSMYRQQVDVQVLRNLMQTSNDSEYVLQAVAGLRAQVDDNVRGGPIRRRGVTKEGVAA